MDEGDFVDSSSSSSLQDDEAIAMPAVAALSVASASTAPPRNLTSAEASKVCFSDYPFC
jgi:hypothetical protein